MSSDEENDELLDLEEIRDKITNTPKSDRMQLSAWEDDDVGVEATRDAKGHSSQYLFSISRIYSYCSFCTMLYRS